MRRLPTKLKQLKGTFMSSRGTPNEVNPEPLEGLPSPPKYFGEVATSEWYDVGRQLIVLRLLTRAGLSMLEGFCFARQVMVEAGERMNKDGAYIQYTNNGGKTNPSINPAWKLYKEAHEKVISVSSRFGFDPVSSSKVSSPPLTGEKPTDPFSIAVERSIRGMNESRKQP